MSGLLDSELEAAMRSLLFWLIVPLFLIGVLCIVEPAYAFEIPFTDIKILEPTNPVINESNPVLVEPTLGIEKTVDGNIVDTIVRTIGALKEKRNVTITHEGKLLAVIPEDSPFVDITVHEKCLRNWMQYGSEQWYACEKEFL